MKAGPTRSPHAPRVGRLRAWLGPLHVTGVFWFRFHHWGLRILPSWAIGIVIALFTLGFYLSLHRIRAAVVSNLDPVLGHAWWGRRQLRALKTFWSFAWCLTERYENLQGRRRFASRLEGGSHLAAVTGRGGIVLTAHLGNWEMGSMLLAREGTRHVHVVRESEIDARAQEFVELILKDQEGSRYTTHFASDDATLGILLLDALRRGELVALQGDRPRGGGKTLDATVFGKRMSLPVGPLVLARAAGAPILPAFVLREGRLRYRLILRPAIDVPETGQRDEDLATGAGRIAREIEWGIRQAPHQWFCFAPVFGGQPPKLETRRGEERR